jgi:hypothetical protein
LIVFYCRPARLLARPYNFECWEALDAHSSTKGLIKLLITVYSGDLSEASQGFGGRFISGFEVFAVATPRCVEPGRSAVRFIEASSFVFGANVVSNYD